MKIDYRTPICGVLPAVLKRLFRGHEYYPFSIKEAAKVFGESEADARKRLKCLHSEGWVNAEGVLSDREDHVPGVWTPTENGLRLAAMPMVKRFSVSEGRDIVKRVIEVVQQANSEPCNSQRITKIILFGSVFVGKDTDDAGDVDLDVTIHVRKDIPSEELHRLAELENEGRSHNLNLFHWGRVLLDRRIKKVSRRISLLAGIIDPEWPQKVVYQFNRSGDGDS
jgi:predicted nucleotidyltransferase